MNIPFINGFYDERSNVKWPKVKRPEKIGRKVKWPIDQKAESNVLPKIIRPNITFCRKQKGRIGAEKGRNRGPSFVSHLLWTAISAYLTITCNILYLRLVEKAKK